MLQSSRAFSGFSVDDIEKAKLFYEDILGLNVKIHPMGLIEVQTMGNNAIMIYPKPNHEPATFTVLNFPVEDIDKAVDGLSAKGVIFLQYNGDIQTDEKGVCRSKSAGEPNIAWFKDSAGNILSVLEMR